MFAERLKAIRKSKSITQKDIAEFLGITVRGYQNYEMGRRVPNYEILKKIAKYLDVTTDYLIGASDDNIVAGQKSDTLLAVLQGFDDKNNSGYFLIGDRTYFPNQMIHELENNTEVSRGFRESVNRKILTDGIKTIKNILREHKELGMEFSKDANEMTVISMMHFDND